MTTGVTEALERLELLAIDSAIKMKQSTDMIKRIANEVSIQHRLRLDVWTDSKRSVVEQSEFKERLISFYERGHPKDKSMVRCMIMDKYFCRSIVVAAHIWKYCTQGVGLEEFGLKASDVSCERNGLILCKSIEEAFDAKRVCFLINRLDPSKIILKVLDPSLLSNYVVSSHPSTFNDIDGKMLRHPEGNIPFRRILDWHAKCSYSSAKIRGWIDTTETFDDFFDMSIGASIPDLILYQDET